MIRFRNPSSSLETMLASFDQLYNELKDKPYFDNDDIANVLAKANLMASSGFTGEAAVSLGSNTDRSRDKTYNNAKMFAEIFRLLGLISVVNNVSSNYRFTFIGEHLVVPGADRKALVEQCVLGMNNPNQIMDVSYDESVRFFSCVLLSMSQLDGCMCRDEMIIGPMCVNDTQSDEFGEMISHIKVLRSKGSWKLLQQELVRLGASLQSNKKEGVSVVSMQNCTRFPISVLKYCGWVESNREKIYGKSMVFMRLTQHGVDTVEQIRTMRDIRLADYERVDEAQRRALIRLGAYQMLARAKFNTAPVEQEMEQDAEKCKKILMGRDLLFSPYQTLEYSVVNSAMQIEAFRSDESSIQCLERYSEKISAAPALSQDPDIVIGKETVMQSALVTDNVSRYVEHVEELYLQEKNISTLVDLIVAEHVDDKKTEYYPLIETLFRIIGVDCHKSRDGVNGERWDAMIRDSERSIPIEIKSPTEELHISIKAIRQALENKIILLSRKTYPTTEECSSYAVGYFAPNERAEVAALVNDIKSTYGFRIAVFDLQSLVRVTLNIILLGKGIDIENLYNLEGIVNVTDIGR